MEERKSEANQTQCVGCRECWNICPTRAIRRWNGVFAIQQVRCMNCGMCKEVCPVGGPIYMPMFF